MFRYDDDANDDPDYQQPASMSQKDEDMDDEDDKVQCCYPTKAIKILYKEGREVYLFIFWGQGPRGWDDSPTEMTGCLLANFAKNP